MERRTIVALAVAGATAFALGSVSAWVATSGALAVKGRGPRAWSTAAEIGDSRANMFTRAVVARTGLWALPTSEVIYFLAERDDAGRPLDGHCTYVLDGGDLPARWWSIGVYENYHFVPTATARYSFTKTNIGRNPKGDFHLWVSKERQTGNWLPLSGATGKIQLLTRLYQPDPDRTANPDKVPLPTIRRVACT